MEKLTETAPLLASPEQANAGHTSRAERDFFRWENGLQWIAFRAENPSFWRKASMKTAFSTTQLAPEPGTPWHAAPAWEVQAQGPSLWAIMEIEKILAR